jgi:2-oxo-4-hydroxy-4-carboxy-5-ureidoimidazoline decarboxylase
MSKVLDRWNHLPAQEAAQQILPCCGSMAWARELAARRPLPDETSLLAASDQIWNSLCEQDWVEAFSKHPRIGERKAPAVASAQSASWSSQEQRNVASAEEAVQRALTEANREYERRFGRVFVICATGKFAPEILEILRRRLQNDDATELRESAKEQSEITNLRLKKWLDQ